MGESADCPVCSKAVDLALTSFVDDLFRRIVRNSKEELEERMAQMDKYLDEETARDNIKQNDKKKNIGVKFYGGGAAKRMEQVYKKGLKVPGKVVRTLRYLGPHMSVNLTTIEERKRRLTAGKKAWQALSGFWSKDLPKEIKTMAFTGLVMAVSMTGLTATVPTQEDTRELDRFFLGCGRRMMRGTGCMKEEDEGGGDTRYKAVPNEEVWRSLGRVGSAEELRVQRLKWFQNITEHTDENCNLLAALFGDITTLKSKPLDHDGRMNENTPRMVRQLMEDLEELRQFDAGEASQLGAQASNYSSAADSRRTRRLRFLLFVEIVGRMMRKKCANSNATGHGAATVVGGGRKRSRWRRGMTESNEMGRGAGTKQKS